MRTLLLLVVVVAAVVVVAELAAPAWVASQAEQSIAEETDDRITVDVAVSGPPLLVPVALDGTVESWSMQLQRVAGQDVPLEVVLDLDEVRLDRGRLVRGDVVVTDVAAAAARVRIDLSGTVPAPLQPFADRLAEAGLARLLDASGGGVVREEGGALVTGDLSLPLARGSCTTQSTDAVVTTRCELTEVPGFVLAALS